jgi:hypothetical protein
MMGIYFPKNGAEAPLNYATTGYCHLVPSEMNSLPRPVAFVVVANEPTGAEVVVELAVIAEVKKYRPAVPLETAAPFVAVLDTAPDVVTVVAVTAANVEVPVTTTLSNCGSA